MLWMGHQLQENGGKSSFVSGAAGYGNETSGCRCYTFDYAHLELESR
jgi:hypothetical protein